MAIKNTPWGVAQDIEKVSEDITSVSTPSHGGYHVTGKAWEQFRQIFPEVKLWAGEKWFEEDVDWSLVVVAFSEHFDHKKVVDACELILSEYGKGYFRLSEAERSFVEVQQVISKTMADLEAGLPVDLLATIEGR